MRKRTGLAVSLLSICTLLFTSSCTTNDRGGTDKFVRQQDVSMQKSQLSASGDTDNMDNMDNTDPTDNDPDLYFGDLGVEQILYDGEQAGMRSLSSATNGQLLDPNGFPLTEQHPNPSITPVNGDYTDNIIQTAKSLLGTPYVYGSDRHDPSSFDYSDFTRWVFLSALGMDLPWDSRSQAAYVKAFAVTQYTSLEQAQPGDLLFFTNYRGNDASDYNNLAPTEKPISHLGIYLGDGKIIHCASKKSGGVHIHNLTWRQLTNRFLFGGSIISD